MDLLFGWHTAVRRQLIDHLRQILAEAAEQFIARHSRLFDECANLVGTKRTPQIVGRYLLVGSGADPRIDGFTLSALLELLEQIVQAATKHASSRPSGK